MQPGQSPLSPALKAQIRPQPLDSHSASAHASLQGNCAFEMFDLGWDPALSQPRVSAPQRQEAVREFFLASQCFNHSSRWSLPETDRLSP